MNVHSILAEFTAEQQGQDTPVPPDFYPKLMEHVRHRWQSVFFCGKQECKLCFWNPYSESANLWIPTERVIYLAPAMISHHIKSHRDKPPEEFVDAVFRCPRQGTPEFMERMKPYMHHWQRSCPSSGT